MTQASEVRWLYVDGGVIKKNPSIHGGTWAWCTVAPNGDRLNCGYGMVKAGRWGLPTISNNVMELYAAIKGLETLTEDDPNWSGLLVTDSKITWWRLTTSVNFNGVPPELRWRTLQLRRARTWQPLLCAGHPTESDLEVGYNEKGVLVSRHNVFCDRRCGVLARKFIKKLKGKKQ